jgi:hypothetical protein
LGSLNPGIFESIERSQNEEETVSESERFERDRAREDRTAAERDRDAAVAEGDELTLIDDDEAASVVGPAIENTSAGDRGDTR